MSLLGLSDWVRYHFPAAVCPSFTIALQEAVPLVFPALLSCWPCPCSQPGAVGFSLVHCFLLDASCGSHATGATPDPQFLWSGQDGTTDTRARVRWETIIQPIAEGGLGLIDPEMQCRALLTKLIVRGLFPGN